MNKSCYIYIDPILGLPKVFSGENKGNSVCVYKCPVCKTEWQIHIIQTVAPEEAKFSKYDIPVLETKYAAPIPEIGELIFVNRGGIEMSHVTDVSYIHDGSAAHFVKVKDLPYLSFNWVHLSKEQKNTNRRGKTCLKKRQK